MNKTSNHIIICSRIPYEYIYIFFISAAVTVLGSVIKFVVENNVFNFVMLMLAYAHVCSATSNW